MLIPILACSRQLKDEWVGRAHAACGSLFVVSDSDSFTYQGQHVVAGPFSSPERAQTYLNNGCAQVLIDFQDADLFHEAFPRDRLVVRCYHAWEAIELFGRGFYSHFHLATGKSEVAVEVLTACPKLSSLSMQDDGFSPEEIGRLHKLRKDKPIHVWSNNVAHIPDVFVACLAPSDRADGLYPTVVSDERGICLGLVYSTKESIHMAISRKRGIYWSRSRNEIWVKGETSGCVQQLVAITLDCDNDSVQFRVEQTGTGFCHLNTKSCFGAARGVDHLVHTLQDRLANAPEGSYTKRLFSDAAFLRDKLVEEAAELSEAVLGVKQGTDTVYNVAAETADVLYFALTAMLAGGANLQQVEEILDKRALAVKRRPGNAKPQRQEEFKQFQDRKRLKEEGGA